MNLQLAIHSSPRFATWMWIPDWHLLIDAGDGATQHLGYKIRKIDTVALTHAHRDHIGGLLQVVNQRGEAGSFAVAHPCGSRSFSELENFANKFNPGTSWRAVWHALEEGDSLQTGDVPDRVLKAFRTRHYLDDKIEDKPRSLGFHLLWRKQKVRPEFRDLSQAELDAMRAQIGNEALSSPQFRNVAASKREDLARRLGREGITEVVDEKWISVGGDGEPLHPDEVRGAKLLLHEATFLCAEDRDSGDDEDGAPGEPMPNARAHGHVHSTVEEALRVAQQAEVENVVLYHISTRYTDQQIRDDIRAVAQNLNFRGRIWPVLPRRVHWNLLGEKPVWEQLQGRVARDEK